MPAATAKIMLADAADLFVMTCVTGNDAMSRLLQQTAAGQTAGWQAES